MVKYLFTTNRKEKNRRENKNLSLALHSTKKKTLLQQIYHNIKL